MFLSWTACSSCGSLKSNANVGIVTSTAFLSHPHPPQTIFKCNELSWTSKKRPRGSVQVQTGSQMISQWQSKYFSQILPFVMPRMVSGPDFNVTDRWRRTYEDAPIVTPREFAAGFARRVEAACRTDWTAMSIVRNVCFRYTAEHTMSTLAPFYGKRQAPTDTVATDFVKAAQNLCHHLQHGFTGKGVHRVPIAGDSTKLPYAAGLSPLVVG